MCEVVPYFYSHKPATDKEEPYTAILPTMVLLTLLWYLKIEKNFQNTDGWQVKYWKSLSRSLNSLKFNNLNHW